MDKVEEALATYRVDPRRLYVTGLSMGGGGTWNMLSRYSDRFAAGVPIAGVSPAGDFVPANLVGLPVWAFHARNDGVVNESRSRSVVNSILTAAARDAINFPADGDPNDFEFVDDELHLRYTEWPTGGHGIWGRVYADGGFAGMDVRAVARARTGVGDHLAGDAGVRREAKPQAVRRADRARPRILARGPLAIRGDQIRQRPRA